jgi:hypothetical protein
MDSFLLKKKENIWVLTCQGRSWCSWLLRVVSRRQLRMAIWIHSPVWAVLRWLPNTGKKAQVIGAVVQNVPPKFTWRSIERGPYLNLDRKASVVFWRKKSLCVTAEHAGSSVYENEEHDNIILNKLPPQSPNNYCHLPRTKVYSTPSNQTATWSPKCHFNFKLIFLNILKKIQQMCNVLKVLLKTNLASHTIFKS